MSSTLAIRKHRSVESFKVCQLLVGALLFWQFRRPETWLAFAASLNAHALARMGGVHPHTTHADWHAWEWQGLVAPRQRPPTSAPPRIPAAPLELLVHLAEQWPATVVQLYGRRSLTKLRTAVSGQRLARAIRREYRRRRLGKRGGPLPPQTRRHGSAPPGDPAPPEISGATPSAPRRTPVFRRPADHCQGLRRATLERSRATGSALAAEDARPVRPVAGLQAQEGHRPWVLPSG